jgi:hypothetical protein
MTEHVYRYAWNGVNLRSLNQQLDPKFPVSIAKQSTPPTIDLTADDSTKPDLDIAMTAAGWTFTETDPKA